MAENSHDSAPAAAEPLAARIQPLAHAPVNAVSGNFSRNATGWRAWLLYPAEGADEAVPRRVRGVNFAIALILVALVIYLPFTMLVGTNWNWEGVYKYRAKFYQGFLTTIGISVAALVLSTVVGLCSALAGRSRLLLLRYINKVYIDLMRGTPFLVQILIFYYVTAQAIHIESASVAGVLILSIFSGAYISEVIRGGIESIGKSQLESAKAIGLTRAQTYRYVIFPQAIRQILPSMAGQLVSIVKDSSLLSIISVNELTQNAREVNNNTFGGIECYIPLAVGYLILTLPISLLTRYLEGRNRFET
jgi:polar amino acid transport system permease protein